MNRPRLTSAQMDSALTHFLLEMSLQTCLSESKYKAWEQANRRELTEEFLLSNEWAPDEHGVELVYGIWTRRKFLQARVPA